MPVTPNKKMTWWREWEETLLGIDGHFSNMESRTRPNGQASLAGEREAISYAAIIYSSLGREEKAFTGVINIFGSPLCSGLLVGCHPTLRTNWDGLFKKAHRLIGDISQSAIYSPIYFHSPFKANFK